jgi:hypothetical protein
LNGCNAAIEENWNEEPFRILSAAALRWDWLWPAFRRGAAEGACSARGPLKPASPAAIAAAKEILAMKNAGAMYASAVPNIVEQTKNALMQSNLNYQKDLNEVAVIVAKKLAGREKEIGEGMAKVYANEFTEQELKDLVTFYKSPLGQKLLSTEPRAIQFSMSYMNQWAQLLPKRSTANSAPRCASAARKSEPGSYSVFERSGSGSRQNKKRASVLSKHRVFERSGSGSREENANPLRASGEFSIGADHG